MKTKKHLLALVVVVLCAAAWKGYGQKPAAKNVTWEYMTIYVTMAEWDNNKAFNRLGAEGWELATAVGIESNPKSAFYTFKRAK